MKTSTVATVAACLIATNVVSFALYDFIRNTDGRVLSASRELADATQQSKDGLGNVQAAVNALNVTAETLEATLSGFKGLDDVRAAAGVVDGASQRLEAVVARLEPQPLARDTSGGEVEETDPDEVTTVLASEYTAYLKLQDPPNKPVTAAEMCQNLTWNIDRYVRRLARKEQTHDAQTYNEIRMGNFLTLAIIYKCDAEAIRKLLVSHYPVE